MKENTVLPKLFIGIDIHKRSWKIKTVTDLFDGKSFTCPPNAHELKKWVDKNYPLYSVSCAYEAGCCGYIAHRTFLQFGWSSKVVNPADIARTNKSQYQKTDKSRKQYKKDYYLLKSIPGIGGIVACGILSELGDLRRFNNMKQLASYVGLIPTIKQSGDHSKNLGMTPRANRIMRSYFVEAAWQALRFDPVMQKYYRKHSGKDSKRILIKVARKLLCGARAVVVSGMEYQTGIEL